MLTIFPTFDNLLLHKIHSANTNHFANKNLGKRTNGFANDLLSTLKLFSSLMAITDCENHFFTGNVTSFSAIISS